LPIGGRRTLAGFTRGFEKPACGPDRRPRELNNKLSVCNAACFYRSLPNKNGSITLSDDRVATNIVYSCPDDNARRLATPCCSPLAPRMLRRNTRRHTNSRYPSRAISRRAADGTKSGGPATARPRVKPAGSGRHMPRIPGRRRRCADRRPPVRCASHFGATPRSLRPREPRVSNGVPDTAPTRVIDDRHSVRRVAARGCVGRYPVPFDNRG